MAWLNRLIDPAPKWTRWLGEDAVLFHAEHRRLRQLLFFGILPMMLLLGFVLDADERWSWLGPALRASVFMGLVAGVCAVFAWGAWRLGLAANRSAGTSPRPFGPRLRIVALVCWIYALMCAAALAGVSWWFTTPPSS